MPQAARSGEEARPPVPRGEWIPQGWQWVDPEKEFDAMLLAIRAG